MSFQKLRAASVDRKVLLPFVRSLLDHDILVAIGAANEIHAPLGYKQLVLLDLAPPTTLRRRLNVLLCDRTIRRSPQRGDGRLVSYSLSRKTLLAYQLFIQKVFS